MLGPLGSKRGAEMADGGFGCIVAALFLRKVDNVAAHARNQYDGASLATFDHMLAGFLATFHQPAHVDVHEPSKTAHFVPLARHIGTYFISIQRDRKVEEVVVQK
jgi:hypothetical protein